jgi:hypothetical protein
MARKKTATKPKVAAKDAVEDVKEVEEIKVPTKKIYVVKFDSEMENKEFIEPGVVYKQLPDRRTQKINALPEPFKIRAGQTLKIDQETYDYLIKKEALITAEQKDERDKYRAKKLKLKSGRAEPKKEMQTLSDEEKIKLFVELPYLVGIEEVPIEEQEE